MPELKTSINSPPAIPVPPVHPRKSAGLAVGFWVAQRFSAAIRWFALSSGFSPRGSAGLGVREREAKIIGYQPRQGRHLKAWHGSAE
jgi:hypothetical protein